MHSRYGGTRPDPVRIGAPSGGDPARARAEAERARRMSAEMGYHWGQVDAAEVLAALEEAENVLRVA